MFLLIHDEIMGPDIKFSYYRSPVNLTKEFTSKLYMSHAGFESSSHIEIKFENFRSISCFTGNLDRRSKKEGILGIIFEEGEEYDNLDPFLQRNLYKVIEKADNEILQLIFSQDLLNYLELSNLFQKVEIEGIQEIFIITGNEEYKSCLFKLTADPSSTLEMAELYKKIKNDQKFVDYQHIKLNIESKNNIFLVLKGNADIKTIQKVIQAIKPYLEKSLDYCLEIFALLFLPSVIRIIPITQNISKSNISKDRTVLQSLQRADNYSEAFNRIISDLIRGDIYVKPSL